MEKILFLAANPEGTSRLALDKELKKIDESLQRSKNREQFELVSTWAVDADSLRRTLLKEEPDIIHFSGHGTGAEGLVLVGEDGKPRPAPSDALAELFQIVNDSKRVRCVLLNACYAEEQAKAIFQHINYVIGMRREVKDDAAIAFATGFYDGLGYGKPIETAFKLGCVAIRFELASFSGTHRDFETDRRLIPVNLENLEKAALPDHLIPVLLSRGTEQSSQAGSVSVEPKGAASLAQQLRVTEASNQAENIQKYRERVTEFLRDGELTQLEKLQLAAFANVLGISETDANAVLDNALVPILDALYERGQQYYQAKKWQRVIDIFREIDAFNTDYPDPDNLRASARRQLANHDRQQREEKLATMYRLARQHLNNGEWQDCLKQLETIQQIQPGYRETAAMIEKAQRAITASQNISISIGSIAAGWMISAVIGHQPVNRLDAFSVAQLAGWVGGLVTGAAIPLMSFQVETASSRQILSLLGCAVGGSIIGGLLWWIVDIATPESAGALVLLLQIVFSVALSTGALLVWRNWNYSN